MNTSSTPLTVIIPARNEASHIARCLSAVILQDTIAPVRIVVVANGCTDATSTVASSFASRLRPNNSLVVCDLPEQGKTTALNLGDRFALDGHRVYLDADTLLSPNALRLIGEALDSGSTHLCAPMRSVHPPASIVTRCYTRIWSSLPYVERSIISSGVYAVSAEGRARWDQFPQIHSDDKFVRLTFGPRETRLIEEARSEFAMPEGLQHLLRARVRWCRGNLELRLRFPQLRCAEKGRYTGVFAYVAFAPARWPSLLIFTILYGCSAVIARLGREPALYRWDR